MFVMFVILASGSVLSFFRSARLNVLKFTRRTPGFVFGLVTYSASLNMGFLLLRNRSHHPALVPIFSSLPFVVSDLTRDWFISVLQITSDTIRPLNNYMELVPLPRDFGNKLLLMSALDFALAYYLERMLRWLLPAKVPNSHKGRLSRRDEVLLEAKKVN